MAQFPFTFPVMVHPRPRFLYDTCRRNVFRAGGPKPANAKRIVAIDHAKIERSRSAASLGIDRDDLQRVTAARLVVDRGLGSDAHVQVGIDGEILAPSPSRNASLTALPPGRTGTRPTIVPPGAFS